MRYVARRAPRAERWEELWYEPEGGSHASITVYEPEKYTFSGLLDANGDELHRVLPPIGFCLTREEY